MVPRIPRALLPGRSYAIDVEFLKTKGLQYARSIAIVPLVSSSSSQTTPSASSTEAVVLPRKTHFDLSNASLLTLQSSYVLAHAEALPAGHTLLPLLQAVTVKADTLLAIQQQHSTAAKASMEQWRAEAKENREAVKESLLTPATEGGRSTTNAPGEAALPQTSSSRSASRINGGIGKPEELIEVEGEDREIFLERGNASKHTKKMDPHRSMYRYHQMRVSIPEHFESFDPHSLPNPSSFPSTVLTNLFDKSVDSADFHDAVQHLQKVLRPYGKGRGRFKSLSFVLEMMPRFAKDVLHASFSTSAEWMSFLTTCRQAALEEVERVNRTYREREDSLLPSIRYRECESLKELSEELNQTWAGLMQGKQDSTSSSSSSSSTASTFRRDHKFYAYGSVDSGVLKRTLALSCEPTTSASSDQESSSAPAAPSSFAAHFPLPKKTLSWQDIMCPLKALPQDRLLTPHQLRVVDVTSHTLYAAAGFLPANRRKISLVEALQRVALKDGTAKELLEQARPHDPVWDAQALGCVCVACSINPPRL